MGNHRPDLASARWRRLRRRILARDSWECQACGKLLGRAEVDHITPVFKGGKPFEDANCQVLCVSCHIAKTRIDNGQLPDLEREAWAKYLARQYYLTRQYYLWYNI